MNKILILSYKMDWWKSVCILILWSIKNKLKPKMSQQGGSSMVSSSIPNS